MIKKRNTMYACVSIIGSRCLVKPVFIDGIYQSTYINIYVCKLFVFTCVSVYIEVCVYVCDTCNYAHLRVRAPSVGASSVEVQSVGGKVRRKDGSKKNMEVQSMDRKVIGDAKWVNPYYILILEYLYAIIKVNIVNSLCYII